MIEANGQPTASQVAEAWKAVRSSRRFANGSIYLTGSRFAAEEEERLVAALCGCGDGRCGEVVVMSLSDYARRSDDPLLTHPVGGGGPSESIG